MRAQELHVYRCCDKQNPDSYLSNIVDYLGYIIIISTLAFDEYAFVTYIAGDMFRLVRVLRKRPNNFQDVDALLLTG